MNEDREAVFIRVNDEKFEIYKGNFGDIMMKINILRGTIVKVFPLFNYSHDLWLLKK